MAKLSEHARAIQKEFLPLGCEISRLLGKLSQAGCYESMRHVQKAADAFGPDVERVVARREKQVKRGK